MAFATTYPDCSRISVRTALHSMMSRSTIMRTCSWRAFPTVASTANHTTATIVVWHAKVRAAMALTVTVVFVHIPAVEGATVIAV